MTIKRWAAKKDANSADIVAALRKAGCQVAILDWPCDLVVKRADMFFLVEIDGVTKYRRRADKQLEFLATWNIPRVKTPEEALLAVGIQTWRDK